MIKHYGDVKTWIIWQLSFINGWPRKMKLADLKDNAKYDLKKRAKEMPDMLQEMYLSGEIRFNGVHYTLGTAENYYEVKRREFQKRYGEPGVI